jgi:hypothetical protein
MAVSDGTPLTPDELEQRQRPDGTIDDTDLVGADAAGDVTSPDELEQRQRPDGAVVTGEDVRGDEVVSADVLEQRQLVGDNDEDDDHPRE